VCSQVRGGVAESDGRLSAGDQIVKVNGEDMSHVTQEFAAALLKVINYLVLKKQPWLGGQGDGPAPSESGFNSTGTQVIDGSRKGIRLKLLLCASKSPTLVGTSEPLSKSVNDINFGH